MWSTAPKRRRPLGKPTSFDDRWPHETAPSSSAVAIRLAIAARSLPLDTGLCKSRRPVCWASAKRPGAVSPVISIAGMLALYSERSRSMTPMPFSSPRRR